MGSLYPSDISRGKFEIIVADLKSCRKRTSFLLTFLFVGKSEDLNPIEKF
ncbi:hypothetical protein JSQ73_002965 [Wolbachia endosymbiont of Anopheles demeilloni]|nr:hypothetical protein [Wolbachia endosymbiont of Anopheles demeilloni]UIP93263.1 hypothetical protein JSQ73_002965 [Wolbachia endosymbiont of Anopheles demeilloni]